jgi:hypothetical protein
MPATKSGNNIAVTGTGNTLASITADIADATFISDNGGGEYEVKGNVTRYLQINNGGVLTIGTGSAPTNPYNLTESLVFENPVDYRNRLYVNVGGTLRMYGSCSLEFSKGASYMYAYIYGQMYVTGSASLKPLITDGTYMWHFDQQNNDSYTNDTWTYDNMIFGSVAKQAARNFIYISSVSRYRKHTFKNIILDGNYGNGYAAYTRGLYFEHANSGMENVTFEKVDATALQDGYEVNSAQAPVARLYGFRFGQNSTDWKTSFSRPQSTGKDTGYFSRGYDSGSFYGQAFTFLESCSFYDDSSGNNRDILASNSAIVVIKDCDFQAPNGTRIQAQYQAQGWIWSGNTFVDEDHAFTGGTIHHVYDLDLTVEDENGNPIEQAQVLIDQAETASVVRKQSFVFETNENGKLANCNNLEVALLSNRVYRTDTLFEVWSSGSNGTSHKVTVSKDGYVTATDHYVMDQSRSGSIVLRKRKARTLAF